MLRTPVFLCKTYVSTILVIKPNRAYIKVLGVKHKLNILIKMKKGTEVVFLDDTNERFGIIEYINEDKVHICGLDGTLYITNIKSILYPF